MGSANLAYLVPKLTGVHENFMMILIKSKYILA